jgi:hypothetical protein
MIVATKDEKFVELSTQDFFARKKLLFVCKQICSEAEKIFWEENNFAITMLANDPVDQYSESRAAEERRISQALRHGIGMLNFVDPNCLNMMGNATIRFGVTNRPDVKRGWCSSDQLVVLQNSLATVRTYFEICGIPHGRLRYETVGDFAKLWDGARPGDLQRWMMVRGHIYGNVHDAVASSRACTNRAAVVDGQMGPV